MGTRTLLLSRHAKDRLRERHDQHLLPYRNDIEFLSSCYELFDRAEFSNRHLNDTVFMLRLREKHGYEVTLRFKEYKNALFVIVDNTVVTVLDTDEHHTSRQHGRVKRI
jgi:hypothetical protein